MVLEESANIAPLPVPTPDGSPSPVPGDGGKKPAWPGESAADEAAGELLQLVASLRAEGRFHPLAAVAGHLVSQPGRWLLGLVQLGLVVTALGLGLEALNAREFLSWGDGVLYGPLAYLYVILPAWSVLRVRAWTASVTGNRPDRWRELSEGLRAWVRLIPLHAGLLVGLTAGSPLVIRGIRMIGGGSFDAELAAIGLHVGASLLWGYVVAEHVILGRRVPAALLSGMKGAIEDLLLLPWRAWRWIQAPAISRLVSGRMAVVPYLLAIWGLTALGVIATLLVSSGGLGVQLMGLGSMGGLFAILLPGAGFDLGVGVATLNYLAMLTEAPVLPEDPVSGAARIEAAPGPER